MESLTAMQSVGKGQCWWPPIPSLVSQSFFPTEVG